MCRRRDRARPAALALAGLAGLAALAAGWLANADAVAQEEAAPSYTTFVRAPGGPPQPVSAAVDGEAARHLPGTGGDPALAAQDLPGVARPAPGATGLVLWGATPAETRVLFDGIELPALYHLGGFRSTVGSELVGRVEVIPGAYSAEYGRALGGLIRIDSRPLDADGTHLALDANLLDSSLTLRTGGAGAGGLRLLAAARTSILGETDGRFAPADATALFPIPRYSDAQLEAALDVAPGATLKALVLTSFDQVRRNLGGAALGLPDRLEDQAQRWWRAGLSYAERGDDDGWSATLFVGADRTTREQQFGPVPASEQSDATHLGLRARYHASLFAGLRLVVGLDGLVTRAHLSRAGSLTLPAREGDLTVFGQAPGDDVSADRWSTTVADLGPFVTASFNRGAWTLSPGLRADAFAVDGSRAFPPVGATPLVGYTHLTWALDPRLSLAYQASPALIVTAAGGLYHQPVDPADTSALFGSPSLGPARAAHLTLSLWRRLGAAGSADLTAFYRRLDDLAVRSPLATPLLAQALIPAGQGRSFGVTLLLRRELAAGTLAWLTYTLSRSQRWTAGGDARLLDFDETHLLTAVASHQRRGWTLSARGRYATGMPRTPVTGSFFDVRDGVQQPIFGAQNSTRLPAFFQVDARVDRALRAGPVGVTLYLDVQNLTGRRNPEELIYNRDFSASGYLTGPPLLVLLGVRIES